MNKLLPLLLSFGMLFGGNAFAAQKATQQITITVVAQLGISTVSLPGMVIGQPYNAQIQVTGGIAPYTYSVDPSTVNPLPAGVTLNAATGVVSGTPTTLPASCTPNQACTIKVTFAVTDSTL